MGFRFPVVRGNFRGRACPRRHSAMSCATRRPCCRTEPPCDVRHFYRKHAPNPRATQLIERTLKLSANIGKFKTLYKYTSERLMHVAAWYHGTPGKSSRNSWNKFQLARPSTLQNVVVLWQIERLIYAAIFLILTPKEIGQISPNLGYKCWLARPLTLPLRCPTAKSVRDICCAKNCSLENSRFVTNQ